MSECNCCERHVNPSVGYTPAIQEALDNGCISCIHNMTLPHLDESEYNVFKLVLSGGQLYKAVCDFCPTAVPRRHWNILWKAAQELNFVRNTTRYAIMWLRKVVKKDVATIIGKIIWGTRYDEAWNGKKLWDKSIDEKWSHNQYKCFLYRGCPTGEKICPPCGNRIVYGEKVVATAEGNLIQQECSYFCRTCAQVFTKPTPRIYYEGSCWIFIFTCTEKHGCVQRLCKCKRHLQNGYFCGPIACQPTMCVTEMVHVLEREGNLIFNLGDRGIYGENDAATKELRDKIRV